MTRSSFSRTDAASVAFPGAFGPANLSDLVIGNFGPDLSIVRLFNGYMDELGLWNWP
jgi:hypothetical protein